jgi:RimJ/RimL family protein N-acetyltransferase
VVGTISLNMRNEGVAEIGYWVGIPHWGKGHATEATKLIIKEGFKKLKLHKIYATHHPKNPASGRVVEKAGMKYEGTLREHVKAKGKYWDLAYWSILRREYAG